MNLEGLKNVKFKEPKCVGMTAMVKNVTDGEPKWVVARPFDGELWYWGRYPTEEKAHEIAKEVGGIVLC